MRYSLGKTHDFQMELRFSIQFCRFFTWPELEAFGPRGVAKIGPGRFTWVFERKFAHQMCVLPSVKLILFKFHCNCRWIYCVYVTDLNFMIFMDFLWFVLLLSFGNGAHFKKKGAAAREVSKKICACNTSRMGAVFFANMCFPCGCQALFFHILSRSPKLGSYAKRLRISSVFWGFMPSQIIQNMQNGCGLAVFFEVSCLSR